MLSAKIFFISCAGIAGAALGYALAATFHLGDLSQWSLIILGGIFFAYTYGWLVKNQ